MSDQDVWAQGRRRLKRCGFWNPSITIHQWVLWH